MDVLHKVYLLTLLLTFCFPVTVRRRTQLVGKYRRGKEIQLCLVTSRDLDLARQWCTIGRGTGINQSSYILSDNTIR